MLASVPGSVSHVNLDPVSLPEPHLDSRAKCILVVDDDSQVRTFTALILKAAGYEVLEADCGTNAIQLCMQRQAPVDLVLADVVMPRMSGRQVIEQIRSCLPGAKCLLMSGYPNFSNFLNTMIIRRESLQAETDFILKPFRSHELTSKVREILDR